MLCNISPLLKTEKNVGLSYIAELIGTYTSGFVAGRLADRLSIYLAKRNNGIMEPEFRLWMFSLLAVLAPFGLFLYGIGFAHGLSYWSLLIGMVMIGFVGPACGSLTVTYIVDCYRDMSGEALITVILIRNTVRLKSRLRTFV
jgi:MFS family permease